LPASRAGEVVSVAAAFHLPFSSADHPPGDMFWLVARPESISLGRPAADRRPWATNGTVHSVTMLGATIRVQVSIADAAHILVDKPHNGTVTDIRPGESVSVEFDPARVLFMSRHKSDEAL
jgi:ABC-type Fe3+/spermidine/putrescine transport system ATPase subunit